MTSNPLENLVAIGSLKREPASAGEIAGLVSSGRARLRDAAIPTLALDSRFDLAYNAAHAFAVAALRWHGYRPESRYVAFQSLVHTARVSAVACRVLTTAHGQRNFLEYEGGGTIDERLVLDLIQAAEQVEQAVTALIAEPGP